MGDRCFVRLEIRGCIRKVKHLERIVDRIESEFSMEHASILDELAVSMSLQENPSFEHDEINYGNVDSLTDMLEEHGIGYMKFNGAGDGYPEATTSFHPGLGTFEATCGDSDVLIPLTELQLALKADDPLAVINELVRQGKLANGDDLPTFTVGPDVERVLAVVLANNALQAA